MSPTHFHDQNAKTNNNTNGLRPTSLQINKDSHLIIKKSPPSSLSSSSSSCLVMAAPTKPSQQRHPVIIYTHSPKIIHTHPKDFKALVQKLTGLSWSDEERARAPQVKQENDNGWSHKELKNVKNGGNDDNESSSVITDENCGSVGDGQVNSCFVPSIDFEAPNPFMTNLSVFTPNPVDLLCPNQSFYNYTESLFFNPPNIGPLEVFNEFRDY